MYCFIDAETNGLYGAFLSVAALVTDHRGQTIAAYHKKAAFAEDGCSDWVREHVLPQLRQVPEAPGDLLEDFFSFYRTYGKEAMVIADTPFPVEARLFAELARRHGMEWGPYPLLDLASMLHARGLDPLQDRREMAASQLPQHNALNDCIYAKEIYFTHIRGGEHHVGRA